MKCQVRCFCWHQNFVPWGLSAPASGLYTCINQRDFFETCNKWVKWWGLFVDIKMLSPRGCLPLPWGYLHVLNHEKKCLKSDIIDIFWNLQQMNEVTRETFLLTSKMSPWGCLPLPRGYIHVLNHWKICIKSDFKEIVLKLATNEWNDETFLLTSNCCPLGTVCPCPGAIYMYKIMKKII